MENTKENIGLSLKTFSLPFLDSKMEYLSVFAINSQILIFEILSQIHILNEEIENVQYYFRLTFDSTISAENDKIIRQNLRESYRNVELKAHIIVDKIDSLVLK